LLFGFPNVDFWSIRRECAADQRGVVLIVAEIEPSRWLVLFCLLALSFVLAFRLTLLVSKSLFFLLRLALLFVGRAL
jgi:hypothetical protein